MTEFDFSEEILANLDELLSMDEVSIGYTGIQPYTTKTFDKEKDHALIFRWQNNLLPEVEKKLRMKVECIFQCMENEEKDAYLYEVDYSRSFIYYSKHSKLRRWIERKHIPSLDET